MGYRLHYCEVYKVHHSANSVGNWQQEQINYVLKSLTEFFNGEFWYSDDSPEFSEVIEIDKETIGKIVLHLERAGDEWGDVEFQKEDNEWIQPLVSELGASDITPKYLAEFLFDALHNGEPDLDVVRFTWI